MTQWRRLLLGLVGIYSYHSTAQAQSCQPWWTENQYQASTTQPCTMTDLAQICEASNGFATYNTYANNPNAGSGCNIPGMPSYNNQVILQGACEAYNLLLNPQDYISYMTYNTGGVVSTANSPVSGAVNSTANPACQAQLALLLKYVGQFPDYTQSQTYSGLATYMSNNLCGINIQAVYNGCVQNLGGKVGPGDPYYVAPTLAPAPAPAPTTTPVSSPTSAPTSTQYSPVPGTTVSSSQEAANILWNVANDIHFCNQGYTDISPNTACPGLFKPTLGQVAALKKAILNYQAMVGTQETISKISALTDYGYIPSVDGDTLEVDYQYLAEGFCSSHMPNCEPPASPPCTTGLCRTLSRPTPRWVKPNYFHPKVIRVQPEVRHAQQQETVRPRESSSASLSVPRGRYISDGYGRKDSSDLFFALSRGKRNTGVVQKIPRKWCRSHDTSSSPVCLEFHKKEQ